MNKRIMVVDDNPVNLKLAGDVLEAEGYLVVKATDAGSAALAMGDELPELILMDIELPGIDGLTLTRWLKADARTRHIPVVALTAFAMKGDENKATEAGCDGYIIKPIDTRTLPGVISDILRPAVNTEKKRENIATLNK